MADKNYCPDCNAFLAYGETHKPLCLLGDAIIVPRQDYETLKDTVLQLQTKYNAVLEDKQRWRNFALLSAATQLLASPNNAVGLSEGQAVTYARKILNVIEGDGNVEPG